MAKVEIISGEMVGPLGVLIGYGTRILVDGQELRETTRATVEYGTDEPVRVTIELLAQDKLDLTLENPLIELVFTPLPGYVLETEQTQLDNGQRLRVRTVPDVPPVENPGGPDKTGEDR